MKAKYATFSIIASLISIIGLIRINYQLAADYRVASGKNQALFGLTEIMRIEQKLYFVPAAIISLLFCLAAIKKNESKKLLITAAIFSAAAIFLFFLRIWKYMV